MTRSLLFVLSLLLLVSLGCRKKIAATPEAPPAAAEAAPETSPPPSSDSDLELRIEQPDVNAMWGLVTEVPISVAWRSGQRYAVQLAPVDLPDGIEIEMVPAIVDPPGQAVLRISPRIGEAPLHSQTLTIEATGYGAKAPVRKSLTVNVIREDGEFIPVHAGTVTVECRNVCGRIENGRLVFYDVLREKEQTCDDVVLPASQQIGTRRYIVSTTGFGYGRTCRVAAIFEPNGALSLINIGGPTGRVPRGETFMTIPHAAQCWLSPDNTLALAKTGSNLRLFDLYSGTQIGTECALAWGMVAPVLAEDQVTVSECTWDVE